MTDREKAIISAYTGIAMLTGDKLSIFHKYVEDILGRSVWTHELADRAVWEDIREKSKADFLALCAEDIKNAPAVKAFTRSELESWLYEIYNNNIDGSHLDRTFAEDVEEIISRLDGFEKYVEDKRREAST